MPHKCQLDAPVGRLHVPDVMAFCATHELAVELPAAAASVALHTTHLFAQSPLHIAPLHQDHTAHMAEAAQTFWHAEAEVVAGHAAPLAPNIACAAFVFDEDRQTRPENEGTHRQWQCVLIIGGRGDCATPADKSGL